MGEKSETRYQAYAQRQVATITEALTEVMLGNFSAVARTSEPDDTFGHLCAMINVSINAARNAQEELQSKILELETEATERKWAQVALLSSEDNLRESEERYHSLAEASFGGLVVHDGGTIVDANSRFQEMFGYDSEELIGMSVLDLVSGEERERVQQRIADETDGRFESVGLRKDSISFPMEFQARHMQYRGRAVRVAACHDITERKKAEEDRVRLETQMQYGQKLESFGVLAGGIAHDFNNLLLAILGNSELALDEVHANSPARENIEEIGRISKIAAELCRQLLAYSGRGNFVVQTININDVVREITHLLGVSVSKKAIIRYDLNDDLPAVRADVAQIQQLIMNLIINASEALDDKVGTISIVTAVLTCDKEYLDGLDIGTEVEPGDYVTLAVTDSGVGMDEDTKRKIFDRFFTTKFAGRGLGMSAALGIVRGHEGGIRIYTEAGKGTTFEILLPASPEQPATKIDLLPEDDWTGEGTVLLVDDLEMLRDVGKGLLETLGFSVITAAHGREAIELSVEHQEEIVCVLLDLTMPEMDGQECFRHLRQLDGDVRIVIMSGYSEQDVTQQFVGRGLFGFIKKPFVRAELRQQIRAVLADRKSAGNS